MPRVYHGYDLVYYGEDVVWYGGYDPTELAGSAARVREFCDRTTSRQAAGRAISLRTGQRETPRVFAGSTNERTFSPD